MAKKSGNQNVLAQDIFEMGRRAGITEALSIVSGETEYYDKRGGREVKGLWVAEKKLKELASKYQPEVLKGIKL